MTDISFKNSLALFIALLGAVECILYKDFIFAQYLFIAKDLADNAFMQACPYATARMEA